MTWTESDQARHFKRIHALRDLLCCGSLHACATCTWWKQRQPSLPKGPTLVPMAPGDGVSGTCGRAVPSVRSRSACSTSLALIRKLEVSAEGHVPVPRHACSRSDTPSR